MRRGTRRAGAAAVAALLLTFLASGCGGNGAAGGGTATSAAPTADPQFEAPAAAPPPEVVGEGLGRRPKPSPSRTTAAPARPKPTRKPPVETQLPPPVPKPSPSDCKPRYAGTQATRAQVKTALTDAAGRTYWPNSAPSIKVPLNMVKAVAWQESGWQSNIIACDGGVGLMQVMQPTADFVNRRFDQNYDIDVYTDNAILGANYLAWLIKYFGDVYFSDENGNADYTLYTGGDCASHTAPCLINAVLAAYNYGFGAVDTDDGLVIPNPRYVENVRALMTECTCLSF
jgi:hypothetical protein